MTRGSSVTSASARRKPPKPLLRKEEPSFYEGLGRAIKVARTAMGLGRKDLAEAAGVSYAYLSDIETGRGRPGSRSFLAIAEALGLSPSELMREAEAYRAQITGGPMVDRVAAPPEADLEMMIQRYSDAAPPPPHGAGSTREGHSQAPSSMRNGTRPNPPSTAPAWRTPSTLRPRTNFNARSKISAPRMLRSCWRWCDDSAAETDAHPVRATRARPLRTRCKTSLTVSGPAIPIQHASRTVGYRSAFSVRPAVVSTGCHARHATKGNRVSPRHDLVRDSLKRAGRGWEEGMETDTGGSTVRFPYLSRGLRLEWRAGPFRLVHLEWDVCPFRLEWGVGPFRIVASTHERSA